jgi:hypothetical protein
VDEITFGARNTDLHSWAGSKIGYFGTTRLIWSIMCNRDKIVKKPAVNERVFDILFHFFTFYFGQTLSVTLYFSITNFIFELHNTNFFAELDFQQWRQYFTPSRYGAQFLHWFHLRWQ